MSHGDHCQEREYQDTTEFQETWMARVEYTRISGGSSRTMSLEIIKAHSIPLNTVHITQQHKMHLDISYCFILSIIAIYIQHPLKPPFAIANCPSPPSFHN